MRIWRAAPLLTAFLLGCDDPVEVGCPAELSITPVDTTVLAGTHVQFSAVGAASWSSSDTSVATIDGSTGLASTHDGGSTVITAAAGEPCAATGSSTLVVTPARASLSIAGPD